MKCVCGDELEIDALILGEVGGFTAVYSCYECHEQDVIIYDNYGRFSLDNMFYERRTEKSKKGDKMEYEVYVNGKKIKCNETVNYSEELAKEEIISARLNNFERLKYNDVKVRWVKDNYVVED